MTRFGRGLPIASLSLITAITALGFYIQGRSSSKMKPLTSAVGDSAVGDHLESGKTTPTKDAENSISLELPTDMNSMPVGEIWKQLKAFENPEADLSSNDVVALRIFLNSNTRPETVNEQQWYALKNEALNVLRNKCTSIEGEEIILKVFHDLTQDPVVRDYALQHLSAWCESNTGKEGLLPVFWDGIKETDSSIAGTALLALSRLREQYPQVQEETLLREALKIADDLSAGELARITALQVAARVNARAVGKIARNVLNHAASIPLQVSAIAAIGASGDSEMISLLEGFAEDNDSRLRIASIEALSRLRLLQESE